MIVKDGLARQGTQVAGAPAYDSCGMVGAGTTYIWPPTEFGKAFKSQLAQPW